MAGHLTLGGALVVSLTNGFEPAQGESFDLLNAGTQTGSFAGVDLPTLGNGMQWDTSALYTTGVITAVPEPSIWALLGGASGALGIGCVRRRRARV